MSERYVQYCTRVSGLVLATVALSGCGLKGADTEYANCSEDTLTMLDTTHESSIAIELVGKESSRSNVLVIDMGPGGLNFTLNNTPASQAVEKQIGFESGNGIPDVIVSLPDGDKFAIDVDSEPEDDKLHISIAGTCA